MNTKRILSAVLLLAMAAVLCACSEKPFEPGVTVKECRVTASAKIGSDTAERAGHFAVVLKADVRHPRYENPMTNTKTDTGRLLAISYVLNHVTAVVSRDGETVCAADVSIDKNSVLYNLDAMKYKSRELRNVEMAFLLPEEYRNERIELVFTEKEFYRQEDGQIITPPESDVYFRLEVPAD